MGQIHDGTYQGQLKCGPALSGSSDNGWTVPFEIQVSGATVRWIRGDARYSERATGKLTANRVEFDMAGQWSPGQNRSGSWRTKASLQLKDAALLGNVSIFTADGSARVRDCVARVSVQTIRPTATAEQPDRKPFAEAIPLTPAPSKREGPLFSSKSQLLDLASTGWFLEMQSQQQAHFSQSIQAVLQNDYGVPDIPSDATCQDEIMHIVRSSFGQITNSRLHSIGDRPPDFLRKNSQASGAVEEVIDQISSQRGGWCSPGMPSQHPYLVALQQLLRDFDQATAIAVENRRKQLQDEFIKKGQEQKETAAASLSGQQAPETLSSPQRSQGAQKSESFLFLKIAGAMLLIHVLVTIYLHKIGKLIIYMDYTDAFMTSIAPGRRRRTYLQVRWTTRMLS